jgi:hypothetical protein
MEAFKFHMVRFCNGLRQRSFFSASNHARLDMLGLRPLTHQPYSIIEARLRAPRFQSNSCRGRRRCRRRSRRPSLWVGFFHRSKGTANSGAGEPDKKKDDSSTWFRNQDSSTSSIDCDNSRRISTDASQFVQRFWDQHTIDNTGKIVGSRFHQSRLHY